MTPEEIKANIKALKAEWKQTYSTEDAVGLYIGELYVGDIAKLEADKWAGCFMYSAWGERTGLFSTIEEAKESVEKALLDALSVCWTGEEEKK